MKSLGHILAGVALAALAACTTPSIRTEGDTSPLKIESVSVDTSKMAVVAEGRQLVLTREQLAKDVTAALTSELKPISQPDGTPVSVNVVVTHLRLAPPVERAVAATSYVASEVSVTEVGTGRVVVPVTEVSGNTDNFRAAGVVALATTMSVENDYRGTLRGYAKTVRKALFGSEQ